jgi:hypothetical protein
MLAIAGTPDGTTSRRSAGAKPRTHRADPCIAAPPPAPPAPAAAGSRSQAGPRPAGAPANAGHRSYPSWHAVLPAQLRGVGWLGQVRLNPGSQQFLDDIPPAGGALQRELDIIVAGKPGQPGPRCSRSAGTTRPRFSSPVTVPRYSNVSWRRCTSNAPTMLMRDLPELLPKLGQGTRSLSSHVVDAAMTNAGEVPLTRHP